MIDGRRPLLLIAISFGLATGFVGRAQGQLVLDLVLIGAVLPVLGLIAAVLYRGEHIEPERRCPRCKAGAEDPRPGLPPLRPRHGPAPRSRRRQPRTRVPGLNAQPQSPLSLAARSCPADRRCARSTPPLLAIDRERRRGCREDRDRVRAVGRDHLQVAAGEAGLDLRQLLRARPRRRSRCCRSRRSRSRPAPMRAVACAFAFSASSPAPGRPARAGRGCLVVIATARCTGGEGEDRRKRWSGARLHRGDGITVSAARCGRSRWRSPSRSGPRPASSSGRRAG